MTTKDRVLMILSNLPDDSTLDDIQYHLYVLQCIEDGESEIRDGKGVSHEEAEERLGEWLKSR